MSRSLPNTVGQTLSSHAVLHGQYACFESFTLSAMSRPGCVRRDRACLFSKTQVRVCGSIGLLHRHITRQGRCYAKFLLLVVDIRDPITGFRSNQMAQPDCWPKNEPGGTWSIPPRFRSERGQHSPVTAILPHS